MALVCASLVAFMLSVEGPGGDPSASGRSATRSEPAPADEEPDTVEAVRSRERAAARTARSEQERGRHGAPRAASIRLRLVTSGTDIGLFEHRVALIPPEASRPCTRGQPRLGDDRRRRPGHDRRPGRAHPEVHGRPAAPEGTVDAFARATRLATLTPAELESLPLHLVEVPTGPSVLYRGGRPPTRGLGPALRTPGEGGGLLQPCRRERRLRPRRDGRQRPHPRDLPSPTPCSTTVSSPRLVDRWPWGSA